MQPPKNTNHVTHDRSGPRRTLRVRQGDTLEVWVAASEAEDTCAVWIADRFSERDPVQS